jgi:uncharacterized protein YukE
MEIIMSVKHGDPDQIRIFAKQLQTYCGSSKQGLAKLRAQLQAMGNTSWKDQNHRAYSQEFQQVVQQLYKVMERFESEQSTRLNNLAKQYEQVKY